MMRKHATARLLRATTDQGCDERGTSRSQRALDALREFVEEHRVRHKVPGGEFASFEKQLHERVMGVERELVAEELERADVDAEAVEIEGVLHRRALRSSQQYMTAAGPVTVERTLFRDRSDPLVGSTAALDGRVGIDYGVYGAPETYLIDREGIIRFKHIGPLTPEVLQSKLLPLARDLNK